MVTGRRITALAFICFGLITAAGCAYTKKDVVQAPCIIADSVTYAVQVEPIIRTNCYACHSTGSNIAGFTLDSYASLKVYAKSGQLYGAISHASGYRPMPDGGGKLDDCSIATIKKWIDSGMPEN